MWSKVCSVGRDIEDGAETVTDYVGDKASAFKQDINAQAQKISTSAQQIGNEIKAGANKVDDHIQQEASEVSQDAQRLEQKAEQELHKAKDYVTEKAKEAKQAAINLKNKALTAASKLKAQIKNAITNVANTFLPHKVGGVVQSCEGQGPEAKAKRLKRRAELIANAKGVAPSLSEPERSKLRNAADEFERDTHDVERAKLSQAVYPGNPVPDGWRKVDPAELGLNPSDFHQDGSNFTAALYQCEIDPEKGKYVLAFKGTDPTNLEDWNNNLAQIANGDSEYYKKAIRLAHDAKGSTGDLEITGHSLGGGLASAAAIVNDIPATTFNPAGLSRDTLPAGMSVSGHDDLITSYHIEGEALAIQDHPLLQSGAAALGGVAAVAIIPTPGVLIDPLLQGAVKQVGPTNIAGAFGKALMGDLPKAVGSRVDLPFVDKQGVTHPLDLDPGKRHDIRSVIDAMESEKSADEQTILELSGRAMSVQ
jgi:hypothetical protein